MRQHQPTHRPLPPRAPWRTPEARAVFAASIDADFIENLVEAVRTGKPCPWMSGPEEPSAIISPRGLKGIDAERWPAVMKAIAAIDDPHPRAQRRFLRSWGHGNGWAVRSLVGDDDVFFRALRVMFPQYRGGAKTLWRGQLDGTWTGISWTSNFMVAEDFSSHGVNAWIDIDGAYALPDGPFDFRIPKHLLLRPLPNRKPVILEAVMHGEIITRLHERPGYYRHEEYICDPRGATIESFRLDQLPDPRL